jgi:hypothetical protein
MGDANQAKLPTQEKKKILACHNLFLNRSNKNKLYLGSQLSL